MNKSIKKLLAICLVAVSLIGVIPVSGFAIDIPYHQIAEAPAPFENNSAGYRLSKYTVKSGSNTTTYSYSYDGVGRKVKEICTKTNKKGTFTSTKSYLYSSGVGEKIAYISYTDSKGFLSKYRYSYDSRGNLIKKSYVNNNAEFSLTKYEFDENGNIISEICDDPYSECGDYSKYWTYDGNGNVTSYKSDPGEMDTETEYIYNEEGKLIKEICIEDSFWVIVTNREYDENGNLIKKEQFRYDIGDESNIYSRATYIYTYDNKGQVTKEVYTIGDHVAEKTYAYNQNGQVTKQTYSDSDGGTETETCKYNKRGQVTEYVHSINGNTETIKYTYDDSGRVLTYSYDYMDQYAKETRTYDNNGNLTASTYKSTYEAFDCKYSYNENGLISKVVKTDPKGKTETTTYEYIKLSKQEALVGGEYFVCLRTDKYVYDGTGKKPEIRVTDKNGEGVKLGKDDYSIKYSNNTVPGKATATITFKGKYAEWGTVKLKYKIVPEGPGNLKVSNQKQTSLKLSWKASAGAEKYIICEKLNGKWTKIAETDKTSITITDLKPGTKHQYLVKSADKSGKYCSEGSSPCTTATKCTTPKIKVSSPEKNKAKISWDKVSGANQYTVYYSTSKDGTYKVLDTVTGTSCTAKNLKSGKTYYFKVTADIKIQTKNIVSSSFSSVKSVKIK